MKHVNYYEWNLEELVKRSQIELNNMINAFKNEKTENVLVNEKGDLLDKLPNIKNEIELKILETTEDEPHRVTFLQMKNSSFSYCMDLIMLNDTNS